MKPEAFRWTEGESLVKRYDLPEAKRFGLQFCSHCGSPLSMLDLAQAGATPVVVDLADVSFLDSAGISLLIQAKKRLSNAGSDLVLRAPQQHIRRVLEISGVTELFRIES